MSTKQSGYVTDVSYPAHFHKEIQPVWLVTLATLKGLQVPDITQGYSYCEIGCGLGVNLLLAAACNPQGDFVGVDFNPQHIAFARQSAELLGLKNLRFIEADFAEFAQSNALFFDFMVCHGVWSWIPQVTQQQLLKVVKRSLKPRGLFYLHYMCHPGATQMMPVQKLLNELAHTLSGTSEQNMGAGLDLLNRLDQASVFHDQPSLSANLGRLGQMNKAYLAHDLLSDHWSPQHSVDVHRIAAQVGLTYLDSANAFEMIEVLSIPQSAQALIANVSSPAVRESLKDLARNQRQRQDLFQKQPQALAADVCVQRIGQLMFELMPTAPRSGGQVFRTPIGEIDGPAELLSPVLERLAQGPAQVVELCRLPAYAGNLTQLMQSLLLLMWRGHVHPQRPDASANPVQAALLRSWIQQHDLKIEAVPSCGTAVVDESALSV
ncbi:class I SAM-dependent methyltransferase [Ectopseudomonas mendocina]|uniref:Class I SAM-dependent methyltransferase n=1 Tax=Ectopseudomonas mendocina TaxID=300 RepID=A0ABZ2RE95_ECTME